MRDTGNKNILLTLELFFCFKFFHSYRQNGASAPEDKDGHNLWAYRQALQNDPAIQAHFQEQDLTLIKHTLRHLLALMQQLSFNGALVLADPHAACHDPLISDNTQMFRNSLKM